MNVVKWLFFYRYKGAENFLVFDEIDNLDTAEMAATVRFWKKIGQDNVDPFADESQVKHVLVKLSDMIGRG